MGTRIAWIEGQGRKEADAYVADVASGAVYRVTVDGETKWSPALDPTGRRLAFLTADMTAYDNLVTRRRLRVLDLATGVAKDLPLPGTDGVPGTLGWSPDGRQLVYELRGGSIGGVYAQVVPPAPDGPADARPVTPEPKPQARTVAWLASPDADRVAAAIVRADEAWDAAYVGPVRAALARWMKTDHGVVRAGLILLGSKGVKEAVPEFLLALGTKRGSTQRLAVQWLARLGARQVVPDLDKLRAGSTFELRVAAAGAMVELGDARGWETLRKAAEHEEVAARLDVCAALWRIREPAAVDLLVPWVGDTRKVGRWSAEDATPSARPRRSRSRRSPARRSGPTRRIGRPGGTTRRSGRCPRSPRRCRSTRPSSSTSDAPGGPGGVRRPPARAGYFPVSGRVARVRNRSAKQVSATWK